MESGSGLIIISNLSSGEKSSINSFSFKRFDLRSGNPDNLLILTPVSLTLLFPGDESKPICLPGLTDFIAILSKDMMRFNITNGNCSQFYKTWVSCPLLGLFLQPVDLIGTQRLVPAGTTQLEDWNNGTLGLYHTCFYTHYSNFPKFQHSINPILQKIMLRDNGFSREIREIPVGFLVVGIPLGHFW